jgi:hypothetical protein
MHLLALLLIAAAPAAQQPSSFDEYPEKGAAGVSFSVSGNVDPTIGATYFIQNDVALRLDLGLTAPLSPSGQNVLFSLAGGLRYYPFKRNHVGLFLEPVVALGKENSPAIVAETAWFFQFAGGVGAEYFFASHFSVGAILQLGLKFANISGPAGTSVYTTISTASSALSVNIYF